MSLFKNIDPSDIRHYETNIQSDETQTQNSTHLVRFVSRSIDNPTRNNVNANYWDFFRGNFYSSGSYPHDKKIDHGLQNYSYNLQPIIHYLYQK